jgi:hypothetical protein
MAKTSGLYPDNQNYGMIQRGSSTVFLITKPASKKINTFRKTACQINFCRE